MGLLGKLRTLASAGDAPRDDEALDQITLRQRVADGIVALRQYDRHGHGTLPPAVEVVVTVGEASQQVARRFVDDPGFDAEVGAQVQNALAPLSGPLPHRTYRVERGERSGVAVRECSDAVLAWLHVEGDPARACPWRAERTELYLGRGRWHGAEGGRPNDLQLAERFVSRAAAVLRRAGTAFTVEPSPGQAAFLAILRADGRRVRPGLDTVEAGARLAPGERIELSDGAGQAVVLRLDREAPAKEGA